MSRIVCSPRTATAILLLLGFGVVVTDSQAWEGHKRAPWVGSMLNGTKCDGGQVPFGPYDYLLRDKLEAQLEVVEESHFNEDVESLRKGMSSSAMGDIHYTLQTWPNHHRALNSALQYRLQHKELWKVGNNTAENFPAECYLQRAMKFSPNDPIPYMLHGLLMHQMKQFDKALKSYRKAVRLRPDDLVTQYNMGLTLVELKKYREARQIANQVYAADFPLPGLKRKLELAEAKKQRAKARIAKQKASVPVAPSADPAPAETKAPESAVPQEQAVVQAAPGEKSMPDEQPSTPQQAQAATPPSLTAEQLAVVKQAMKNQKATKSNETASGATP